MTSVPAWGSVSMKAPMCSPLARGTRYLSFCPGVALRASVVPMMPAWNDTVNPVEEQARATSSTTRVWVTKSAPAPPYSAGRGIPIQPPCPSLRNSSAGWRLFSSISAAMGSMCFSANSRMFFRMSSCSSVSLKSM